jgi:hypothetical protein
VEASANTMITIMPAPDVSFVNLIVSPLDVFAIPATICSTIAGQRLLTLTAP